jgi:hypothetical protein
MSIKKYWQKYWLIHVCAVGVLLVAGIQHDSVPLYDGVALPDEPYRYVSPPPGVKMKTLRAPTSADQTGQAMDGFNQDGIYLNTMEQKPQVYIGYERHTLAVPSKTTSAITVRLKPLAPDTSASSVGKVAGNMYQVAATSTGDGQVTFVANNDARSSIDLRLPQGFPVGATVAYRQNAQSPWRKLATKKVGNDVYESQVEGLGDYVMISSPVITPKKHLSRWATGLLVIFASLTLLVLLLLRLSVNKRNKKK